MPTGPITASLSSSEAEPQAEGRVSVEANRVPRAHQPIWEMLAAVFMALIAHHAAIHGVFHQDDAAIIHASTLKHKAWEAAQAQGRTDWNVFRERPIYYLSLLVNHHLAGNQPDINKDDPFGFHLFNLIGHLIAVAGLYMLVASLQMRSHRLLRKHGLPYDALAPGWGAVGSYLPLFAAVLFAIHPLASEPVAYVMARANGWGGAFFLWFWAFGVKALTPRYGLGRPRQSMLRPIILSAAALLCLIVSFGFKETHVLMAVLLPLSLWVCTPAAVRAKIRQDKRAAVASGVKAPQAGNAKRYAVIGLVVMVLLGLTAALLKITEPLINRVLYEFPADPATAVGTQAPVWLWNFGRLFVPLHVSLEYDHPFRDLHDPIFWYSAFGHVLILGAVFYFGKRRPWLRMGLVMTYITLMPTNSILLRYDLWSDRNAYLACAAGCVILAGLFQEMAMRLKSLDGFGRPLMTVKGYAGIALFVVWVGLLSYQSHVRDKMYADPVTFWTHTCEVAPNHPRAHLQLAYIFDSIQKHKEAKLYYQRTVDLIDETVAESSDEAKAKFDKSEPGLWDWLFKSQKNETRKYFGHSHWSLWRSLAETRLAQFDIEEGGDALYDAEERLYLALQDNPGDLEPLRAIVDLYLLMNEPESAYDIIDEVLEDGVLIPKDEEKRLRDKVKNYEKQKAEAARG